MKKTYFKHGRQDLRNRFSDEEYKKMTDAEKAMWIAEDQLEADIPEGVLDFQTKHTTKLTEQIDKLEKEIHSLTRENKELKVQIEELENPKMKIQTHDDLAQKPPPIPQMSEDEEKKILREQLRQKGIKTPPNIKLETLRNKLKDAAD